MRNAVAKMMPVPNFYLYANQDNSYMHVTCGPCLPDKEVDSEGQQMDIETLSKICGEMTLEYEGNVQGAFRLIGLFSKVCNDKMVNLFFHSCAGILHLLTHSCA